jgi:hypothetical protein
MAYALMEAWNTRFETREQADAQHSDIGIGIGKARNSPSRED